MTSTGDAWLQLLQQAAQLDLHTVGVMLDSVQLVEHFLHHLHLGAAETGLHQLVQLVHGVLGLAGGINGAVEKIHEGIDQRLRELHFATQHQASDVLGLVGDAVLGTQQFEEVGPVERHEHAVGQFVAQFLLKGVGLAFKVGDPLLGRGHGVVVALGDRLEKGHQRLDTIQHLGHMVLQGADRRAPKDG